MVQVGLARTWYLMIPLERNLWGCQEPLDHQDHLWVPVGQVGLVVPADQIQGNWNLDVLGGLGDLGLPWDLGGQVGLEDQRRSFLSQPGKILVGLVGLASLLLVDLGVLAGREWQALVAHVVQVGLGDLVNQDLEQRGPRRWSCQCS